MDWKAPGAQVADELATIRGLAMSRKGPFLIQGSRVITHGRGGKHRAGKSLSFPLPGADMANQSTHSFPRSPIIAPDLS